MRVRRNTASFLGPVINSCVDVLKDEVIGAYVVQLANAKMIQRRNYCAPCLNLPLCCFLILLIATMRLRRVSRVFHTSPMPPASMGAISSLGRVWCRALDSFL